MWHYALRRTAHLFLNQPCEYITNISERCTLSWGQSGQIRCPSVKDGGVGVRRWPTVKIWPPSGGQLADLITAYICLGRWMCLSRSCRKPSWCCYICRGPRRGLLGQFAVWKQMKSIWILLACPFWKTHLTFKTNLIFTHSRWEGLHGLWFWLTRLQRVWVFSQGDSGDKNVRLTTHLWSISWGEPDTNITTPEAQHVLAYKHPADQQIRYRENSCTAGSDAFFNTHLISRGKSQFGHRLNCLVTLNTEL